MSALDDVVTALEELLNDAERTSMELPHMTTGQRKNTKKLLEKYPELQCESYGFGADRKLVVFKKSSQNAAQESQDSNVEIASTDGSASPASPQKLNRVRSLQGSPAASLPDTSEELQVRNTFIHFEGLAQKNERAVQSMPHGMFKQCILAEVAQGGHESASTRSGCDTPDTPTSACERESLMESISMDPSKDTKDDRHLQLGLGALVIVEGLTKVPAFNGCSAVIQGWDEEAKRYNILLAAAGGCQQAKIKQENLRVVMPCP
jgi:hypothetical protein